MPPTNGWNEWGKHVLKELEEQATELARLREEMTKMRIDLATLRTRLDTRAGIMGAVGALIPIAIAIGMLLLKQSAAQ